MEVRSGAETPLMRQYLEVKEKYPDSIVFFRLGDFYEMFYEDAVYASSVLDLTLTSRDRNKENRVPMCGIPYHSAKQYIGKLIEQGKKVAICEQVEDARLARTIVRRAVTQVITPGVVIEEDHLNAKASHYLAAMRFGQGDLAGQVGLAYLDVSTGEFSATQMDQEDVLDEICRIHPSELLDVGSMVLHHHADWLRLLQSRLVVAVAQAALLLEPQENEMLAGLQTEVPVEASLPLLAKSAAAACLGYARAMQASGQFPVFSLRCYHPSAEMVVDDATSQHLELFQAGSDRKNQGSLLWVLDHTCTASGGRLLRRWLSAPLQQIQVIAKRHDVVDWFVHRQRIRDEVRSQLAYIHDVERIVGRLTLEVATPRDLGRLAVSLRCVPKLNHVLKDTDFSGSVLGGDVFPALLQLGEDLCQDVAGMVETALVDDPPPNVKEGGVFRPGYNAELDELVSLAQGGKQGILDIEQRERERTHISSLKISYNRVFGYYIEVTRTHLNKVPADYIRKQTLAQVERFVTPELTEYEAKVLGAEERRLQLEETLFLQLRKSIVPHALRLKNLAEKLSQIDVLASLAHVAHRQGYVRPHMVEDGHLHIKQGRHPVLEQWLSSGQFVPNDVHLHPDKNQIYLITGPNMAGKSTIMRQTALICILAQMGSFVPAKQATLGVLDRVFARVGASDNLTAGDSTFMVEMRETAHILAAATRRSLVLMDEIGRGTSTYDGISIAWAVAEYLHDHIGCKTLFATHYHELCGLAETHPRIRNVSVAVRPHLGSIVFLHQLVDGAANRSYGIEVAKLAGLPPLVLERSRQILQVLEMDTQGDRQVPHHRSMGSLSPQLSLFARVPSPSPAERDEAVKSGFASSFPVSDAEQAVLLKLRSLDLNEITPKQAMLQLMEWLDSLQTTKDTG